MTKRRGGQMPPRRFVDRPARFATPPPDRSRESASTVAARIRTRAGDQQVDAGGQVEQSEAVRDHRDDERADRGVHEAAAAAEEADAADDRRRDTAQHDVAADRRHRPSRRATTLSSAENTARLEQITNAHHLIQRTLTPERRAASALPPIA